MRNKKSLLGGLSFVVAATSFFVLFAFDNAFFAFFIMGFAWLVLLVRKPIYRWLQ